MATTESPERADRADEVERDSAIIVNGTPKTVRTDELSFEHVLRLAFDPVPVGPNITFTVSYRHADQVPAAGTLHAGQSVKIKDGTVFNATATDKS